MRCKNRPRHLFTILVPLLLWLTVVANAQTAKEIRRSVLGSMVVIETEFGRRSGFFVAPNLIATTYHVIYHAERVSAWSFSTKEQFHIFGAVAIDADRDLAILRINGSNYSYLRCGDRNSGTQAYVVGNEHGGEKGGWRLKSVAGNPDEFLVTIPIARNSSGGPVLNKSGIVMGILVRGVASPDPMIQIPVGWAVDAKHLNSLLDSLLESVELDRLYSFPIPGYSLNSWGSISRANMMLENWTPRVEAAIEAYNEVLNSDSGFAVYLNRAMAQYRLRRFAQALDDLRLATGTSTFSKIFKTTSVVSKGIKAAKAVVRAIIRK